MNTFKRCVTTDKEKNNEINSNRGTVEKKKGKGGTNGMSSTEDEIKQVKAKEVKEQETIEMETAQMRMRSNEIK